MRGAHGVHVVLLHQADVLEQGFHGRNVAQQRMRIVPVDAQELDGPAVHPELLVPDFDGLEAHVYLLRLDGFAARARYHHQLVEVGGFRRPGGYVLHGEGAGVVGHGLLRDDFALVIELRHHVRLLGRVDGHAEQAVLIIGRERGTGHDIAHVRLFVRGQQVHIAENAREAPAILVFQIGAVAPLEHLHAHQVLARAHLIRDVEFAVHVRHLAKAHDFFVHGQIEHGIHAIKIDGDALPLPVLGQVEIAAVHARRILRGHMGRIHRDGVVHIGVLGDVVSVHLPAGRHGKRVRVLKQLKILALKAFQAPAGLGIHKVPRAIE